MFSEKYKTKWHDTDASRRVTATKMLVLMQETSNHHLESAGPSLDKLRDERGLAFLLSKIRMRIYKPLYAAEDIEVQTWTYASRGYSFPRCYRIVRGEEIIAEADTVWALVDIRSRALIKAADCDAYEFEDQAPSELDLPTRFRLPVGLELVSIGERRIVWSDLDYNMHMNNTRYPDMLCDFLPPEHIGRVGGIFLSYVNEAAFGDTLDVRCVFENDTYYFRTVNSDGKVCLEASLVLNAADQADILRNK